MKFVKQNRHQLTVYQFPTLFWGIGIVCLIFAALFPGFIGRLVCISFGFLFIGALGETSSSCFDKTTEQVLVKRWNLLGSKRLRCSIRSVVGVEVQRSQGESNDTYRVSLVLAQGEFFPLTLYYSSGLDEKQKVAHTICDFLSIRRSPIRDHFSASPAKLMQSSFGGKEWRTQEIAEYRAAIAKEPDKLENYYYLLMLLGMEQQQDEVQASLAVAKESLVKRGQYGHAAVLDETFKNMKIIRF